MRYIVLLCLIFIPTISYAEDYSIRDNYGNEVGGVYCNNNCSIRNEYGQEVGRLVPESTYEAPKYMPEVGSKEDTNVTVHLPSINDMMK